MIYLKLLAALILSLSAIVVIIYRISVLISRKYDKKEKLSSFIELILISCFLILILG